MKTEKTSKNDQKIGESPRPAKTAGFATRSFGSMPALTNGGAPQKTSPGTPPRDVDSRAPQNSAIENQEERIVARTEAVDEGNSGDVKPIIANVDSSATQGATEKNLDIADLSVWAGNPRHVINKELLDELIVSLRENGQQNAIDVIPDIENPGKYLIISGQRRWLATKEAGLNGGKIRARIRHDLPTTEAVYAAAIDPQTTTAGLLEIDFAISLGKLKDDVGVRPLARALKRGPGEVSKLKQIGLLPDSILEIFKSHTDKFSYSFAYEVVLFHTAHGLESAIKFADEIKQKNYTLKKTQAVRESFGNVEIPAKKKNQWSTLRFEKHDGSLRINEAKGEVQLSLRSLNPEQVKTVREVIQKIASEQQ